MGNLATHLQQAFIQHCPQGWHCDTEVRILSSPTAKLLGYAPQVDVLMQKEDGTARLWIEFEVSRADPVANHAKFATAHLFEPQASSDIFLAMCSSHVQKGKRKLAANTIWIMRHIGMNAFQTTLLPNITPHEIKRLNHLTRAELALSTINIADEVARALLISQPLLNTQNKRIHFASNAVEVILNVRQWNKDILSNTNWRRRNITYFVYDPISKTFAPSKFCAYASIPYVQGKQMFGTSRFDGATMSIEQYLQIEQSNPIFDGNRARMHLIKNLGMKLVRPRENRQIAKHFQEWAAHHHATINIHPNGEKFLVPPS